MLVELVEVSALLLQLGLEGTEPREEDVSYRSRDTCVVKREHYLLLHLLLADVEVLLGSLAAGESVTAGSS